MRRQITSTTAEVSTNAAKVGTLQTSRLALQLARNTILANFKRFFEIRLDVNCRQVITVQNGNEIERTVNTSKLKKKCAFIYNHPRIIIF